MSNVRALEMSSFGSDLIFKVAGIMLATVIPALFWTTAAAFAAPALGIVVTGAALAMTGAAIALFLGAVCAPLMLQA